MKALKGSYAVFAVTNYWEKMDDKLEIQQGKNLADAAKVCDLDVASEASGLANPDCALGGRRETSHLEFSIQCQQA